MALSCETIFSICWFHELLWEPYIDRLLPFKHRVDYMGFQVDGGGNDGACSGTVVARTFLIRTKTEEDRDKLAAIVHECAPPF